MFERVRSDYLDVVSDNKLIENALDGMLTGLDPHSGYMNAEGFRDMELETEGKYGGIGIEVSRDNGFVEVVQRNGRHACRQGRGQRSATTSLR